MPTVDFCVCNGFAVVLMTAEDERCFCIGSPGDPAAEGSPFLSHCDGAWGGDSGCASGMGGEGCCVAHTLAFADMVRPAAQFVLDVTGA